MTHNNGFIVLRRSLKDWYGFRCPKRLSLWIHLLLKANHADKKFLFNGEPTLVKRGQFITGRKVLSKEVGLSQTTLERILKEFEKETQIGQQKTNTSRLITIINYSQYQESGQRTDNKRTTDGQQTDTNNNVNNVNNVKRGVFKPPTVEEVCMHSKKLGWEVNLEKFFGHYESNGWMVGKNKMKSWKACLVSNRDWLEQRKGSNDSTSRKIL